ncbi:MAG: hypothetical protein K1000chlam1_00805 [Candidatus Anoxychlamydiales bacterium]|nr:hypothetical protein [Candidatus Anoxychlamydiales bacterium]
MKKNKNKHKKYHFIIWSIVTIFIAILIFFAALQTPQVKERIKSSLITYAKKNNIELKIEKISGSLPFEYNLKNVSLQTKDQKIDIQDVVFRLRLLSLIKKELNFSLFYANEIKIKDLKDQKTQRLKNFDSTNWISYPIALNFNNLKLNNFHLSYKGAPLTLNIQGKAKYYKFGRKIKSVLKIKRSDVKQSYLDIAIRAYKKNRLLKSKAYLSIASAEALDPFYLQDLDFAFDLNLDLEANIDSLFKGEKNYFAKANGNIFKIQNRQTKKPYLLLDIPSEFSFDIATFKTDLKISKGFLKNDIFRAYFDGTLKNDLSFEKSNLILRVDELTKINTNLYGSLIAKSTLDKKEFLTEFNFKDLRIKDIHLIDLKGNIKGSYVDNILIGKLQSDGFALNQGFNILSDIKYETSLLNFSNFQIFSPSSKLFSNFKITPNFKILGNGKIHFSDFSQIQVLFPTLDIDGASDVNFTFNQKIDENDKSFQNINFEIFSQNYHFKNVYGRFLDINLDVDDPFFSPIFDYNCRFKDVSFHELYLKSIDFAFSTKSENWPYTLRLIGAIKKPIELTSSGFFNIKNTNELTLNIQDLQGLLFTHNFRAPKSISIETSNNKFVLKDLEIEMPSSKILADINFTKNLTQAKISLKSFPLDFLSINPLDLDITGFANLDLILNGKTGSLNIDLEELKILALGDEKPLIAKGELKSTYKNDYYNIESSLKITNSQLFAIKGNIPIDLDPAKLKLNLNENKDLSLDIKYIGRVEEILDFVNIGPQRLEGNIISEIHLSNKLSNLITDGYLNFKNGFFENYYTGTILQDINANLIAENEKISLKKLTGFDPEGGSFAIDGLFSLSKKKSFPFLFNIKIDDLLCVDSNIIRAYASASVELSGDALSSQAKGVAKINNLQMSIPDKLPIVIPGLKATFVSHRLKKDAKAAPRIYPIHLNIDLDAKEPIYINGQGLTSSWSGNFKLGGTFNQLETIGELKLIKGLYLFSGRRFDLTKGDVIFDGRPNALPTLDIDAKMQQSGVDILAHIEGDLDTPKISFSSTPPLPASSIMSLLIFGQELSELSDFQTIELASTISQKIGDSKIADSKAPTNLGIDRFNIVQPSPTDPTTDQMAIQFGKYITKGIVVSLSQGQEQGSSNIIVEVDLKKGFVFQAESQQQEEQGKFSLKWRRNY